MEWHEIRTVGLVLLALLGAVPAGAQEPPRSAVPPALRTPGTAEGNVRVLMEGMVHSMEKAAKHLEKGERRPGAEALDGAERVGHVALAAATGPDRGALHEATQSVMKAKTRLQNGDRMACAETLRRGARDLERKMERASPAAGTGEPPPPAKSHPWSQFQGGVVINSRGEKLGEIDAWLTEGRDVQGLVLVVGGWRDVLGFLDFGGHPVELPLEAVVFGEAKLFGAPHVAVAAPVKKEGLR